MTTLEIDQPTSAHNAPRYTRDLPNPYIAAALQAKIDAYRGWLTAFQRYFERLRAIDVHPTSPTTPAYVNGFLPGLDCVTLYCFIAELKPQTYFEVGSGPSTKFARRAISDFRLPTRIVSVNAQPNGEIDPLCDEPIHRPVEEADLALFDRLRGGDILFFDNSHRCFMNSDVTVAFLDLLPRVPTGVYVHLHDIFWPEDYPADWNSRYYNEQYVLGALLANGMSGFEIVMPNYYIASQPELARIVAPVWDTPDGRFAPVERHGCSFWLRKR